MVANPMRVEVPGCIELLRVFVDGVELPLEEDRNFSRQDLGKEPSMVAMPVPLVSLEHVDPYGTCLVRSLYSNDGLWQVGSTVVVVGEWDEGAEETFVSSSVVAEKEARIATLEAALSAKRVPEKESPKKRARKYDGNPDL